MLRRYLLLVALVIGFPAVAIGQTGMGAFDFSGHQQYRPVEDISLVHPDGHSVLSFTLPGGSCSRDDCQTDRERAQLVQRSQDNVEGESFRYTVSFYLPADFKDVSPANVMFWEVKPLGNGKPSAVIEIIDSRLQFSLSNPALTQADKMNPERPVIIKQLGAIPRGRWTDITIDVRWAHSEAGLLKVYHNGRLVVDHRGANIDANSRRQVVMFGIYRSFISRYLRPRSSTLMPTQQVFFANVSRQKIQL